MIRGLAYRITIICINILFPPLAVLMVAGCGWDFMLNCIFLLLAVIPSHIHGFYITYTYFHRRGKVNKGIYPGGPASLIHSQNVLNGGASNAEVQRLWQEEHGGNFNSSRRSDRGLRKSEMGYVK